MTKAISDDTKNQLKAGAVAVPVGFATSCIYQMLRQKLSATEAVGMYLDIMREGVFMTLGMLFLFYVAGMFGLFLLGYFGEKAKRLLE